MTQNSRKNPSSRPKKKSENDVSRTKLANYCKLQMGIYSSDSERDKGRREAYMAVLSVFCND